MGEDELDRARAQEAAKQQYGHPIIEGCPLSMATCAARLAREGWLPPDPLEAEVDNLLAYRHQDKVGGAPILVRLALERGIEIGRSK